jgi:hypothetical protein
MLASRCRRHGKRAPGASDAERLTGYGLLETAPKCWPKTIRLNGLTYERLLGLRTMGGLPTRYGKDSAWYIEWLARDSNNPSQPYQQLAKVLRDAGADPSALRVLFKCREIDRRQASIGAKIMLWL